MCVCVCVLEKESSPQKVRVYHYTIILSSISFKFSPLYIIYRERARGSVGYLSKTAVYKTWSMQSCLQRSTGRGPRSQKVECYTIATRNILHWDGQQCEPLQFSSRWYVCAQKSRRSSSLHESPAPSRSYTEFLGSLSHLYLLKLRSAMYFIRLDQHQDDRAAVSFKRGSVVLCLLLLLSSSLGCPQSCWWLFWHFWWCSQSPHFSSGHKSLKLNCCTVSKKLRN